MSAESLPVPDPRETLHVRTCHHQPGTSVPSEATRPPALRTQATASAVLGLLPAGLRPARRGPSAGLARPPPPPALRPNPPRRSRRRAPSVPFPSCLVLSRLPPPQDGRLSCSLVAAESASSCGSQLIVTSREVPPDLPPLHTSWCPEPELGSAVLSCWAGRCLLSRWALSSERAGLRLPRLCPLSPTRRVT